MRVVDPETSVELHACPDGTVQRNLQTYRKPNTISSFCTRCNERVEVGVGMVLPRHRLQVLRQKRQKGTLTSQEGRELGSLVRHLTECAMYPGMEHLEP